MNPARYPLLTVVALGLVIVSLTQQAVSRNQEISFGSNSAPTAGESSAIQDKPKYQSTGLEGDLSGTVFFEGDAPVPAQIDMGQDPGCEQANPEQVTENVVVASGRLANVFVYIKAGQPLDEFDFSQGDEAVTLHHSGCMFRPRVIGLLTNQSIEIVNDDRTTHNTHPVPARNTEWNYSTPAGGQPLVKSFAHPEIMIPVKCNQHPWEKAYIGVLPHPFFAVTDEVGSFSIRGIPPGTYTVVAWHEKFGEQTVRLTIAPNKSQSQDFTYKSED